MELTTGCCKTFGQLCKPLCDSFFGLFLLFFCSFDCQILAIFHFATLWPWEWIFFWKCYPEKCWILGLAQISSFLMIEFWVLPTLVLIILYIYLLILKILVLILLQITWIFQKTPNFLHLDDFEGFRVGSDWLIFWWLNFECCQLWR